ncbi:Integrase core domain protein [Bacteroidales bacterium Barb6]|nr:Integrase core domain protein [Bacteroidales bacterium Barb6]
MKDESSKVIYAEVSTTQTAKAINQMIVNGIQYFKDRFGIKIVRIQTDHCNSFKEVKLAKDMGFRNILKVFGITHRYCIFKRPETNGTIERHHLTVTKELRVAVKLVAKNNGVFGIMDLCKRYLERFNFRRYHSYTYRLNSKVHKENDIPAKRLEYLKSLPVNSNVII